MTIILGIYPKNQDILLKYMGGIHSHLPNKVMIFKLRIVDEACI
jgi:hypothetical protein